MWRNIHGPDRVRTAALAVLAGLTMSLALVPPASAAHGRSGKLKLQKGLYLKARGPARPPVGFLDFCDRHPRDCRALGSVGEWRVRLDATRWKLLQQVNTFINRRVQPMTDEEIYGQPEVWEYPVNGRGDCEDYVLLKKRYLEGLGFPAEALLISVVLDEKGGGHAVLLVRTDRGDLVLDNRRDRILPWYRTGYTYLMRQSQRDPGRWVALSRNPARHPRAFGGN